MDDRTQCSLPTVVLANKSDLRGEGVGVRGEEDLHMETLVSALCEKTIEELALKICQLFRGLFNFSLSFTFILNS